MFVILSVILINLKSAILKKQNKAKAKCCFSPMQHIISLHAKKRDMNGTSVNSFPVFFFNYREAQICNMSSFVLHLILSSLTNHN